jgi:hypothetical protein
MIGGGLALFIVAWLVFTGQRLDERKGELVGSHQQLDDVRQRVDAYRTRIERLIRQAAADDAPERYADERLQIAALHKGRGIYLRIPREAAESSGSIHEAALGMRGDAITRCLGIAPISLRGFYESQEFLQPTWRDRVLAADDELVLQALENDLRRRIEQDIPSLQNVMGAEYLLLVLESGASRASGPVDVFLWNLRQQDERVLSVRATSRGLLLPARIDLPGVEPGPRVRPLEESGIADDCSIAAQIKEVTGEPVMGFESGEELERARQERDASDAEAAGVESTAEAADDDAADDDAADDDAADDDAADDEAPEADPP